MKMIGVIDVYSEQVTRCSDSINNKWRWLRLRSFGAILFGTIFFLSCVHVISDIKRDIVWTADYWMDSKRFSRIKFDFIIY